jgi:hypothetical protein
VRLGQSRRRSRMSVSAGSDIIPHSKTSAAGVTTRLPVGGRDAPPSGISLSEDGLSGIPPTTDHLDGGHCVE